MTTTEDEFAETIEAVFASSYATTCNFLGTEGLPKAAQCFIRGICILHDLDMLRCDRHEYIYPRKSFPGDMIGDSLGANLPASKLRKFAYKQHRDSRLVVLRRHRMDQYFWSLKTNGMRLHDHTDMTGLGRQDPEK